MSDENRRGKGVTRRRILIAGGAAVSAVAVAKLLRVSLERTASAPPKPRPSTAPVAIVSCDAYRADALREAIDRGFRLAPPPEVSGKTVLLKPNFVEYSPSRPVTTNVELIRATVRAFYERGAARVVIGEGPGHNPDTHEVWSRSGLFRLGAEERAEIVDLNVDDLALTRVRTFAEGNGFKGRALEQLYLPKTLLGADVIVSMPKLKTHHWAGFTLGMKNLFGVVPSVKYGWPKNILHVNGIVRSIVELAASIPVAYTLVDGVEAMEGDGPIMGTPVPSHCLVFGRSLYAVDWVGTRLMGFDPAKTDVIRLASATGFGALEDPVTVGESIASLQRHFVSPPVFDSLRI